MALTPRPTAEQIKALREQEEIGLYEAKGRLHDAWAKENLKAITEKVGKVASPKVFGENPLDNAAMMAQCIVDFITIIETAMDEDSIT